MTAFDDLLAANAEYAASYPHGQLPARAARGLGLVTCMDSRVDPFGALGLRHGDAKILRTAGARISEEVLRSLVIAHHLLGVDRILVLAHTDCAMAGTSDQAMHAAIRERSGLDSRSMEFRAFDDQQAALEQDVQRVRSSPYLPAGVSVAGGVYDVRTGVVRLTVD